MTIGKYVESSVNRLRTCREIFERSCQSSQESHVTSALSVSHLPKSDDRRFRLFSLSDSRIYLQVESHSFRQIQPIENTLVKLFEHKMSSVPTTASLMLVASVYLLLPLRPFA